MEIIHLQSTDSTNSWLTRNEERLPATTLVYCDSQTSGRGQRGNSWESEPLKNITASLLFRPENYEASKQFSISEAIALAIIEFLQSLGIEAMVKWPNDIYVDDKKICGILVEHVVTGKHISRCIAGFGINVNQTLFHSNAPNPVSVSQLKDRFYDIPKLVIALSDYLQQAINSLNNEVSLTHRNFLKKLWRNDGRFHPFFDKKDNCELRGKIRDVSTDGTLHILTAEETVKQYVFKEIEFLLK